MGKTKTAKKNPIQAAILEWIQLEPLPLTGNRHGLQDDLLNSAPKRFTIYEPMALLPSGSFTSIPWSTTLGAIDQDAATQLWLLILREISTETKDPLTHLAVNEGIPLQSDGAVEENIRRSPSGLRILHGDFGESTDAEGLSESGFDGALWVSTKQNGIFQTWAPRWTMFSRGNIKEKARLLDMQASARPLDARSGEKPWAVDLYAGIGYFVFSYARLGLRVLCWEINPWSVDGLRRGAKANRWSVRVVKGEDLALPSEDILSGDEQIIVFQETNEEALRRIRALQDRNLATDIRHVNCGFLPTSEPVWRHAWELCAPCPKTQLHLHENVATQDTQTRKDEIQRRLDDWASEGDGTRKARAGHVELVKTFAPGVWHCVFDVCVESQI